MSHNIDQRGATSASHQSVTSPLGARASASITADESIRMLTAHGPLLIAQNTCAVPVVAKDKDSDVEKKRLSALLRLSNLAARQQVTVIPRSSPFTENCVKTADISRVQSRGDHPSEAYNAGSDRIHYHFQSRHYHEDSLYIQREDIGSLLTDSPSNSDVKTAASIGLLLESISEHEFYHQRRQSTPSVDMEFMDSRRISQAAEIGLLTPRGRKSMQAHGCEFASSLSRDSTSSDEPLSHCTRQGLFSRSWFIDEFSNTSSYNAKIHALPLAVRRTSMPDVISFAQFCKTAPPSPPLEGRRSSSIESFASVTPKIGELGYQHHECLTLTASPPESVVNPGSPLLKRISTENQPSEVLRGHGTGFEILKPGSLSAIVPASWKTQNQRGTLRFVLKRRNHKRLNSQGSASKLQNTPSPSIGSFASSQANKRNRVTWLFRGYR